MEDIRDCTGKLVCVADAERGMLERQTSKERIVISLPVGGIFAYETKIAYTEIERKSETLFNVNSFRN